MEHSMQVTIAGVTWKNPVTVASGTFGSGMEYSEKSFARLVFPKRFTIFVYFEKDI